MRFIFYSIITLITFSCKWEMPELKTFKKCEFSSTIDIKPNGPNTFDFQITGNLVDIKGINWELKKDGVLVPSFAAGGNIISLSSKNSYSSTVTGNYTVSAFLENVCGEKSTISNSFSIKKEIPKYANLKIPLTDPTVMSGINSIQVTNEGYVIANEFGGKIYVWDLKNNNLINSFISGNASRNLTLSKDDKYLFVVENTIIKQIDWKAGKEIKRLSNHSNFINDIAISGNNKYLISAGNDNKISIWDVATGNLLKSFNTSDRIVNIEITNDGNNIITELHDGTRYYSQIYNGSGAAIWTLQAGVTTLTNAIDPNGRYFYISNIKNGSNYLTLYSMDTKTIIKEIDILTGSITISNDGQYIFTGDYLFDAPTGRVLYYKNNHFNWTSTGGAISSNYKYTTSYHYDGSIALSEFLTGKKLNSVNINHPSGIRKSKFSKINNTLLTNDFTSLRQWDLENGKIYKNPITTEATAGFYNVAVMSNGIWLKTCGLEKKDFNDNVLIKYFPISSCDNKISVSHDDKYICTINNSNNFEIRDANTGILIKTIITNSTNYVPYFEFSHDNSSIISIQDGSNKTIKIWNIETSGLTKTIQYVLNQVDAANLSNDGLYLSIGDYQQLQVFDIKTGTIKVKIALNGCNSRGLALSPDSKLVSRGACNKIEIYDTVNGVKLMEKYFDYYIVETEFSPSGNQLFVTTQKDFHIIDINL